MLIGFFRQGSCVSLNNAAVPLRRSFSSFIRWQKLLNAGFLGVVHIADICLWHAVHLVWPLVMIERRAIFLPGGPRHPPLPGLFGGSPFRLAYRPFHYQHVESFFCEHFGPPDQAGNMPHRFRIVLHLIFGNIQENLIQASFGLRKPGVGDRAPLVRSGVLSKYRSG